MNFEIAPKSTEIESNWDDARLYCFALNIDGKTGWRLPTKKELWILKESDNDFAIRWYWSSTENENCDNIAWCYYGGVTGGVGYNFKDNNSICVRAVRSID
jgi:hypothetical protein